MGMLQKLAAEAHMSEEDYLRVTLERTDSLKQAAQALQMSEAGVKWHMAKYGFRVTRKVVTEVVKG